MDSQFNASADHLVVLIHGLWGNPVHLNHIRDRVLTTYSEEDLHVLVAKSNSNNNTYDGIEVGGERVANEIEERLEELEKNGNKIRKISIAGYSLGGLISRYAVGLLYSRGLFEKMQPMNFTTFASPHLGTRAPATGYRSYVWNILGARTLGTSGQQMFLIDNFRETGRPLLSVMADSNSVFVKGLAAFKNKWFYANTLNDRSVPYYTAAISRTDPFVDLDNIEVHFADNGQDVLLEPSNPVTPRKAPREDLGAVERLTGVPKRTVNSIPFYAMLTVLLPVAVPLFLGNALYQTYTSAQRVRLHESGSTMQLNRYRVKLLEEAQAVQDRVYERMADSGAEEYLPTPPPESAASSIAPSKEESDNQRLSRAESAKESSPFPLLALTEGQFEMIENLSKIGITVFPAHIRQVRHTHAAIVVRIPKESFSEGRAVSRHWAGRFEV